MKVRGADESSNDLSNELVDVTTKMTMDSRKIKVTKELKRTGGTGQS